MACSFLPVVRVYKIEENCQEFWEILSSSVILLSTFKRFNHSSDKVSIVLNTSILPCVDATTPLWLFISLALRPYPKIARKKAFRDLSNANGYRFTPTTFLPFIITAPPEKLGMGLGLHK